MKSGLRRFVERRTTHVSLASSIETDFGCFTKVYPKRPHLNQMYP